MINNQYLALAHWRHTVAEMYAAIRQTPESDQPNAWKAFRASRDRLIKQHSQSPLDDRQRVGFASLPYYAYDPAWRVAGVVGALAVLLGAFGAHGIEQLVEDPVRLQVWDTAARYHLFHAVALGLVAAHPRRPALAGIAFSAGIVLFSGSLYVLALTGLGWLGAVTPVGGLAFLVGWVALAAARPTA